MACTIKDEDINRVKGLGFLHNKGTDLFNGRVITRNGKITAEQAKVIAEAAEKFGSGEMMFTTRLTVEVRGIHYDNIEHDTLLGTKGQYLRLEALKLNLTGVPDKTLCYEVHVQNIGWQGKKKAGETAGTTGKSYRIEAVKLWLE